VRWSNPPPQTGTAAGAAQVRHPAPTRATLVPLSLLVWLPTWLPIWLLVCLGGCDSAPIEAVAVSDRSLTRELVAHWAFDEQGGTTVTDGSGNAHDGQLTGGSWEQAGRFGTGLRLVPGDSVTFPLFRDATPDWTVSVWIKLSAADRAALTADRAVLLSSEKGSMGGWEIEFDPRPGFEYLEASYYVAPPTNAYVILPCRCIETDRWMHWTAVFDSTTHHRVVLYQGAAEVTGAMLPAPILPGDRDLSIGRWYQGPRPLSGVIDDFAIWSRALSADEVAAIDARVVPGM
jgi:Concanavalin A-like lectin/glucanases superfamily